MQAFPRRAWERELKLEDRVYVGWETFDIHPYD